MRFDNTMLILIGFQNDYFARNGILRNVIDEAITAMDVVGNTVRLIEKLQKTSMLIVETPILFTNDFRELPADPRAS